MALSGSFYTNVGSGWRLQLEWTGSQSISGNYTDITAKLYWISLGSSYTVNSSATKDCSISIGAVSDSKSSAGMADLNGNQKKLIHTYTRRINHNADGSASVTLDGWFDAEITLSGTYYGRINLTEQTYALNTIPRESTITSSLNWTAPNSVTINIDRATTDFTHDIMIEVWNSDTQSYQHIKTITGVGWTYTWTPTTAENTEIFQCLATDTGSYNQGIKATLTTKDGSTVIGTNAKTGTISSPSASTVSSGTDRWRYIDENFNVGVTRSSASFLHTITINCGSFSATQTGVGTSYNFVWSQAQMDSLYSQMPNAKSMAGTIEMTTYYNGVKVRNTTSISCEFHVRNSDPIFSESLVRYEDIDTAIVAITGNNQYIVQNKSNFRAFIDGVATPQNSATISSYELTLNGVTKVSSNIGYYTFGLVSASSDQQLTVSAVDSRGFKTTVQITVTIVPYSSPIVTTSSSRLNGFETSTTVKLSGSVSPVSVGGVNKNAVVSMKYEYKLTTDASYPTVGAGSPADFTAGTATFPNYLANDVSIILDNLSAWNVRVTVTDNFGSTSVVKSVPVGQPILFVDSVKKSIGVNQFPTKNNAFEVTGIMDINVPTSTFGGLIINNPTAGFDSVLELNTVGGDWSIRNDDSNINMLEFRWNNVKKLGLSTVDGNIWMEAGSGIYNYYNNGYILRDHANGNVTLSATGGDLYLGYSNTTKIRFSTTVLWSGSIFDQENWIAPSLLNGWTNYSTAYPSMSYRRTTHDTVQVRGMVKDGAGDSTTSICQLPSGYRPIDTNIFICEMAGSGGGFARIDVQGDGLIRFNHTGANQNPATVGWVALEFEFALN